MRRGLLIGGWVLLFVGFALIAASFAVNSSVTQNVPAGSAWSLTPKTIGSASVTITWTGAPPGAAVYLVTGTPVCGNPGGVVATGSGISGTITATLNPGTTYLLYACSGASYASASFTYTASGFSYLNLGAGAALVLGAALMVLGLRAAPKPAAARPAPRAAPATPRKVP